MKKLIAFLLALLLLSSCAFAEGMGAKISDITVSVDDKVVALNPELVFSVSENGVAMRFEKEDEVYLRFNFFRDGDNSILSFPDIRQAISLSPDDAIPGVGVMPTFSKTDNFAEDTEKQIEAAVSSVINFAFPEGDYSLDITLEGEQVETFVDAYYAQTGMDRGAFPEIPEGTRIDIQLNRENGVLNATADAATDTMQYHVSYIISPDDTVNMESDILQDGAGIRETGIWNPDGTGNIAISLDIQQPLSMCLGVTMNFVYCDGEEVETDITGFDVLDYAMLAGESMDMESYEAIFRFSDGLVQLLEKLAEEESVAELISLFPQQQYSDVPVTIPSDDEFDWEEEDYYSGSVYTEEAGKFFAAMPESTGLAFEEAYVYLNEDRAIDGVQVYLADEKGEYAGIITVIPLSDLERYFTADNEDWLVEVYGDYDEIDIYGVGYNVYMTDIDVSRWSREAIAELMDGFVMPNYAVPEPKTDIVSRIQSNIASEEMTKPEKKTA